MKRLSPLLLSMALAGCATAPPYSRPEIEVPAAYKEAPQGWTQAAPADAMERGPWWQLFGDAQLNALASQALAANQTVAASVAAYDQARAAVREQRASFWPGVNLQGGASRSGGSGAGSSAVPSGGGGNTRYQLSLGASWAPDFFGRVRNAVGSAEARAQASEADLASSRLAILGELATDYFSLRETDAEATILRDTIAAYERSLQSTRNRYDAGVAPKSDVLQAQTQLANAQADLVGVQQQRAQFEHAIAVLVGRAPGGFSLPVAPWNPEALPAVPPSLPSTLLQRRPDIAAAERRVAAANADIGVARTGYFPNLTLSASDGFSAARLGDLFSANAWSLGLSLAQTVFDAGATSARVDEARAAWAQSVAQYRQTVLDAFRDVEDQLASQQALQRQYQLRREASEAADQTEQQVMNRYRAGQVSFSEVVQAQVSALSARRALVQLTGSRQTAAVALVQALGGGWPGFGAP
jgi:NodT family efflux transporter outer membrane factor (OMF) lipoprotein